MSATAIMKMYSSKWSLEVFFKESRRYCNLGKSRSVDFDAHIFNMSLSMILYTMCTFYTRIHDFETIEDLFETAKLEISRKNMAQSLW